MKHQIKVYYFPIFLQAKNAKFQYSISGDPEHVFSIDPNIGRVELNKSVDYEMKQQYAFLVRVILMLTTDDPSKG
jgi:hypothetical protein